MNKPPRPSRDDTLVILDNPDDTDQLRRQDPKAARKAKGRDQKSKPRP